MTGPGPSHADRPLQEPLAHLRLLERVATVANKAATLEEAAAAVLEDVGAYTGWSGGRFSRSSDPALSAVARRVVATGVAGWADQRRGFPVLVGDEVVAVWEFVTDGTAPPDEALQGLMASVGHQLARIVERDRAAAALRQSEGRYRALAESAQDAIVTADSDGRIVSFNQAAERTFGYREDEIIGRPLTTLMPGRFHDPHLLGIARIKAGGAPKLIGRTVELAGLRGDGREFPLEVSLSSWEAGDERFYAGIMRDISERRQAQYDREAYEHQLVQRALHDPLTGLPNRLLLHDRLEHALALAARRGTGVVVLAVDLDRFKVVNDGYGHQVGDDLLVEVAQRVAQALRPDDTVARTGGDEFGMLCEDVSDRSEARGFAERVAGAFTRAFLVEGHEVALSASVGAALAPPEGARADAVLRNAEMAMEQARQRGPGQSALYEESMRADEHERQEVEHDLRLGLRAGQLRLHYQPIIDLTTGAVAGVEALVRWEHPTRGLLMPQQFIRLAEESGLIVPLGKWVLEEACHQGAAWQRGRGVSERLRVSVNVSARQFQQPQWADEVAQVLLTSGFEPEQLVLEITESVLMEDTRTTAQRLGELRNLGVRIAIDDFGTGYSSLGYLRDFPVDILKVDKSFIDGVAEGPHESALARAVIKLAATLHLDAVAEGVSTRKQLATLRRLRCRFAQGYYFSPPQPASALTGMLSGKAIANW